MTDEATLEKILAALPADGTPIPIADLQLRLREVPREDLSRGLARLHGRKLVLHLHQKGWKKL